VVAGGGFGAAVKAGGRFATAGAAVTVARGGAVGVAAAVVVVAAVVATGATVAGGVGEIAGVLSAGFSVTIVQAGMTTARPRANISALCSIFMITAFK
jgi:predicted ABC-type sugar transport system permease subunit